MKKGFLAGLLTAALLAMLYAGTPKPGPMGEIEPVKPVLSGTAKLWSIRNDKGIQPIAWYQRVTMPDGTTQELKSRTLLTTLQWQAKAQVFWDAQVAAELIKPKPCTRCGGTGVEPQ